MVTKAKRPATNVDWASLEDAVGRSAEVPEMIGWLRAKSRRDRAIALDRLRASIVHQGSVYPATVAAAPLIIALLDEPRVEDKGEILCFLQEIAIGEQTNFLDAGFEAREGVKTVEGQCYTAVAKAHATIARFLDSQDEAERAGAAFALGWLSTRAVKCLPLIRKRLKREGHPDVRAGLLFAIGNLTRGHATRADQALLEGYFEDADARVRAAAAIGRVWAHPKTAPADARRLLQEAAKNAALRETEIPWNWHDVAGLASRVHRARRK